MVACYYEWVEAIGECRSGFGGVGVRCKTNSNVEYRKDADFTHYRTFAVLQPIVQSPPSDTAAGNRLVMPAREAAAETLMNKGFVVSTPEVADFLVRMKAGFVGEGPIKAEEPRQERRMLTIEIVDRKTQEVVWSRWRSRVTNQPLGTVQIREIVAEMLKPFPPQ